MTCAYCSKNSHDKQFWNNKLKDFVCLQCNEKLRREENNERTN